MKNNLNVDEKGELIKLGFEPNEDGDFVLSNGLNTYLVLGKFDGKWAVRCLNENNQPYLEKDLNWALKERRYILKVEYKISVDATTEKEAFLKAEPNLHCFEMKKTIEKIEAIKRGK